jgi:hypothetical protein
MSNTNLTHEGIRFQLSGEPLDRVITWQREVDLLVFRYQIETHAPAIVVYHPKLRFPQSLTEVPKPGEAIPYYGSFSQAYVFTFLPYGRACRLKAENFCSQLGHRYPKDLPSLELELPESIQIETYASRELWAGPGWAWWYDDPAAESASDTITFAIDGEMYDRMVDWGWDRDRLDTYAYQFWPLSVGCEIVVRDTTTGEEERLTKDVCW